MFDSLLFSGEEEESSEVLMEDKSGSGVEAQNEASSLGAAAVGRKQKNQKKKFDISLPARHLVRSQ